MIDFCLALIERTGLDRAAICRLENGTHENPTISTLNRYAEALGRRISFRVVDVGGSATRWTESAIALADEQTYDEDQKNSGLASEPASLIGCLKSRAMQWARKSR